MNILKIIQLVVLAVFVMWCLGFGLVGVAYLITRIIIFAIGLVGSMAPFILIGTAVYKMSNRRASSENS